MDKLIIEFNGAKIDANKYGGMKRDEAIKAIAAAATDKQGVGDEEKLSWATIAYQKVKEAYDRANAGNDLATMGNISEGRPGATAGDMTAGKSLGTADQTGKTISEHGSPNPQQE